MLHGRAAELAGIHELLEDARAGRSSVLVIQGEAGSGKTALLEHVATDAKDFRVLRCTGVESEAELPFAALHLLLLDCLDRLDALPAPQAAALRAAFGLAEAPGVDRFLAGLATLTLLSEVAGDRPLLCLIDDAQWLDRASWDALVFAGRRLGAEGVAVLIGVRDDPGVDLRGLRVLELGGLSQSAAAALLAERAADLAPNLCDRLIEEANGNPLALIELAAAMRAGDAATGGPTVTTALSTTGRRVLDAFGSQLDRLPPRSRLALLVAAAEDTGELGVVLAAAKRIGLALNDFDPAERVQLVQIDNDVVTFRHPLIRSAVYGRAPATDRIAVHRALADALPQYADRRAWHLSAAAAGFDDEAADAMEAAAIRADRRGGYAASAAAHERAARLTADPALRGQRLAAAAQSARDSGQLDRAARLAREASALATDVHSLAGLAWVRARVEFERGTPRHASEMVLDGAAMLYDTDPEQAAKMLIEAVRMAYFAAEAPHLAKAIEMIDALVLPELHPLRPMLAASSIIAKLQAGWPQDQVPPLPPVVDEIQPERLGATVGNLPAGSAFLQLVVGHADEALAQSARMLIEARDRGMIGGLPHILLNQSQAALVAGRLQEALRAAEEGIAIAEDTGQQHSAVNLRGVLARITAMTGDESRCVELAEEAMRRGNQQHSSSVGLAALALAVLTSGTAAIRRRWSDWRRCRSPCSVTRPSPTSPRRNGPRRPPAAASRSGPPKRSRRTSRGPATAPAPSFRPRCTAAALYSVQTTRPRSTTKPQYSCTATSTGRCPWPARNCCTANGCAGSAAAPMPVNRCARRCGCST